MAGGRRLSGGGGHHHARQTDGTAWQRFQPSPVKQYAVSQGLKVLQPEKLKDENFLAELRLESRLADCGRFPYVAGGGMEHATLGYIQSGMPLASVQYRGAAPINWAVINGETETGITTFFLEHEIDTGEIIDQVRVPIADTDNVEIVYDKLMHLGRPGGEDSGCHFGRKCEDHSTGTVGCCYGTSSGS